MPTAPKSFLPAWSSTKQQREKARPNSYQRGYTRRWNKARTAYLNQHPLCVHCERQGKLTPATELDHIIPHRGNQALFWDFEHNVQGLCRSCHSSKTVTEDGGFGNGERPRGRVNP